MIQKLVYDRLQKIIEQKQQDSMGNALLAGTLKAI